MRPTGSELHPKPAVSYGEFMQKSKLVFSWVVTILCASLLAPFLFLAWRLMDSAYLKAAVSLLANPGAGQVDKVKSFYSIYVWSGDLAIAATNFALIILLLIVIRWTFSWRKTLRG